MGIFVGIDPGINGGISFVDKNGSCANFPMPDIYEFRDILKRWNEDYTIQHVFLEKAHAMPKQGVTSMFNYGHHCGQLQGILISLELPYTLVLPQEWQREMFKGSKDKETNGTKRSPKERALEIVRRLFPKEDFLPTIRSRKPHDGMIDSILLAEFCRRKIL